MDISSDRNAVEELNTLVEHTLKDGVSIVAIDKLTGTLVGVAVNKLQVTFLFFIRKRVL